MKKLLFIILLVSNYTYGQVTGVIKDTTQIINKPQHDPPETINYYTAVLAFDICTNSITVSDAGLFNAGDTVLMIQMKGAVVDTSNTPAFGTILDYKNAGNYEFNFISQKSGNVLTFLNKLTRSYDIPEGVVQLVRVPKYKAGYFSGGLVPLAWNGATGGIVCVYASTSVTSVENIDVSGRGFRGATGYNASSTACNQNNYYYPASSQYAAFKGESIGSVSQNFIKGKGNIAGGGGGGNGHNSGGGGGGNGGAGGNGGYQSDSCNATPLNNGGIGGKSLQYNSTVNKIFMGSGGGAGHLDNANANTPPGGAGGGILIIITPTLEMYEELILANGEDGIYCNSANCNDGNSGGGAGGTIVLSQGTVLGNLIIETKGGKGADMFGPILPGGRAGPGGGGGGGVLFYTASSLPGNATHIADGGANGVIQQDANNPWGATAGNPGLAVFDVIIPYDSTGLFTPNIDSVRIKDSVNYCNNIRFKGFGFTNTYAVSSWLWDFGDGGTDNTQNPIHNYNAVGNYNVKLTVTDINGCKDSIIKTINTAGPMLAEAGRDTAFCVSGQKTVVLNGSGTGSYSWSPAAVLNNNTLPNPTATINTTTKFYLTVSNGTGCSAIDSVTITINQNPIVKTLKDTSICKNATLILTTTGAVNYNWSPGIYVSDSTIASPQYIDTGSHTLMVTGTDAKGCMGNDTINVNVKTPVTFIAPQSKTICKGASVQLNGNNGNAFQYLWSPAFYLSNPNIKDPVANPPVTTTYTVTITDNTCNYDSSFVVDVTVLPLPFINATKSNDINCNKPFAQLNATGALNYNWTPAYALSNSRIANPIANPAVSTTYFVTVADVNGCNNTDSITLIANFGNNGILLSNSFTPNGDGNNDCFGIRYYQNVQDLEFIIYNRYGIIVFETHNAAECWNGHYKGQPADAGSYIYFISAKTQCGNVVKKGSVLLVR